MAMASSGVLPSTTSSPTFIYSHVNRGRTAADRSATPENKSQSRISDIDSVLTQSLRNENDLLRCQLNDLISREKNQRIELQRLRQHRDAEVASLVQSTTAQLRTEVNQLKGLLQTASTQLQQVLNEKEEEQRQRDHCLHELDQTKQHAATCETRMAERIQGLEDAINRGANIVNLLADSVGAFQRHVLPTFKPSGLEIGKLPLKAVPEIKQGRPLIEQLTRLENGLTMLRVIVDAKNDTLVLIRGKLKQENEDLKSQVQRLQEKVQGPPKPVAPAEESGFEKRMLRQELQSLQELFNAEVQQLKAKLKAYEEEKHHGQGRILEVQEELGCLQNKLNSVEASKSLLENSLKEETTARTQLVSQIYQLRKENEKAKTELETLKLNQKFFVRQPRGGRIPAEKMDLMNTVNQLLVDINKVKNEKVALEEELKALRRSQVRDRVRRGVTSRDVEMAASNKVGDGELASKLARSRLQQLVGQDGSRPISPAPDFCQEGLQGCLDMPSKDEFAGVVNNKSVMIKAL